MGLIRSGYKYLFLLNGRYYFWMKVPKDLRSHFPSPWLKRSLKTDNLKNAKTLVNSHISKFALPLPFSVPAYCQMSKHCRL